MIINKDDTEAMTGHISCEKKKDSSAKKIIAGILAHISVRIIRI